MIKGLNDTAKRLEAESSKGEVGEEAKMPGKSNEELVNFLEHKLEEIESKLTGTQRNYDALQKEYVEYINRSVTGDKYKRAALIMTDFLQDMIHSNPNILKTPNTQFDPAMIKGATTQDILNLGLDDKVDLVTDLLKMIQPYLSANNLSVEPLEEHRK